MQQGLGITRQLSTPRRTPSTRELFHALCTTRFVRSCLAVTLARRSGATGLMKAPKEVMATWQSGSACLFARKIGVTYASVDVLVDRPLLSLPLQQRRRAISMVSMAFNNWQRVLNFIRKMLAAIIAPLHLVSCGQSFSCLDKGSCHLCIDFYWLSRRLNSDPVAALVTIIACYIHKTFSTATFRFQCSFLTHQTHQVKCFHAPLSMKKSAAVRTLNIS